MSKENDKEKDVVERTRRTFSSNYFPTGNIFQTNKAQLNHKNRSIGEQNPLRAVAIVLGAILACALLCAGIIYIHAGISYLIFFFSH
jgi:hypothetical protein